MASGVLESSYNHSSSCTVAKNCRRRTDCITLITPISNHPILLFASSWSVCSEERKARNKKRTSQPQHGARKSTSNGIIVCIFLLSQICRGGFEEFVGSSHGSYIYPLVSAQNSFFPKEPTLIHSLFCHPPKVATVPPVLVKTPQAPTFCFVKVFCMADTNAPPVPVVSVALMVLPTASRGWYESSSVWLPVSAWAAM